MEEEICRVCGRNSKEANLLTAVLAKETGFVNLCENCAIVERAVIIQKPDKKQIQDSEAPCTVYERLSRISGVKPKEDVLMKELIKQEKAQQTARKMLRQRANKPSWGNGVISSANRNNPEEKQSIKINEGPSGKEAVIDFSSEDIKIGDLHKLKNKLFG